MRTVFLRNTLNIFILYIISDCYGDFNQSVNVYAYLEKDVTLPCQLAINNTTQRWLKESSILTTGRKINNTLLSKKRFNIDVNYTEKKYNLLIANVSEFDYGDYKCIIQNKLGVLTYKSTIILKRQGTHDINDDDIIIGVLLFFTTM